MATIEALESLVGSMTIGELAARSGRSVEDLVAWAMRASSGANGRAPAQSGRPKRRNGAAAGDVNTRTADGRESYDRAVLEAIQSAGGAVGAANIRSQVGGSPIQFRAAVTRLIEAGEVGYKGKARATRYFAK